MFSRKIFLPIVSVVIAIAGLLVAGSDVEAQVFRRDDSAQRRAVIVPLHEMIHIASGGVLERKIDAAIADGAEVLILDVHSPGGFTNVTFDLMDQLLDLKGVETVAWIERDALSGAALLSLACDKIYMRGDARIGDAGEIVMGADGAYRYTDAKSRSALAQKVRDTATATGRSPALAEKMVDKDVVVHRVTHRESGEVSWMLDRDWKSLENTEDYEKGPPLREGNAEMFLTLNGSRAAEIGLIDGIAEDRAAVLELLNVRQPVEVLQRTTGDTVVWLLNTKVMAFLLIMLGLAALLLEVSAPGLSFGGLVSLLCFSLFFWSRFLGGTAGWLEVTLFALGLIFIACEVFLIPGTGLPGVTGLGLMIASLVMASQRDLGEALANRWMDVGWDVLVVVGAIVGFGFLLAIASQFMDSVPGLSRFALEPPVAVAGSSPMLTTEPGPAVTGDPVQAGVRGWADSPLRPGGRIRLEDRLMDATSETGFIDAGTPIEIVRIDGNRLIVREA